MVSSPTQHSSHHLPPHSHSDFYSLLGVSPTATAKELRQAYLQTLVSSHPDKGGSAEKFAAIQKAYAVLSNPRERTIYDEKNGYGEGSDTAITNRKHPTVQTTSNGVTAYVHGQETGVATAPCATTQVVAEATALSRDDDALKSIGKEISTLTKRYNESKDAELLKVLAERHVQRGRVHAAAHRHRHAEFDGREALRLWPECASATALLQQHYTSCSCITKG